MLYLQVEQIYLFILSPVLLDIKKYNNKNTIKHFPQNNLFTFLRNGSEMPQK